MVTYKHDSSETEILLYNNTKGWIIQSSQDDIILIRPTQWESSNSNIPVPERGWKFAVSTTTGTTYFDDQSVAVHEFEPWYYDTTKIYNLVIFGSCKEPSKSLCRFSVCLSVCLSVQT